MVTVQTIVENDASFLVHGNEFSIKKPSSRSVEVSTTSCRDVSAGSNPVVGAITNKGEVTCSKIR